MDVLTYGYINMNLKHGSLHGNYAHDCDSLWGQGGDGSGTEWEAWPQSIFPISNALFLGERRSKTKYDIMSIFDKDGW